MRSPALLRRQLLTIVFGAGLPWAAGGNEVTGTVIDPVSDGPVADVEVAFLLAQDQGLSELVRRRTDGDGRFRFSGPFLSAGTRFGLVAFFRDIPYPSATLEVGAQQEILLEVFEPTEDASRIHIPNHHLFISTNADLVEVSQLLHLENLGDSTYVGLVRGGERRVVEFILPSTGLFGFESHSGQMTEHTAGRVAHTQPLMPGSTQIAFTYQIDVAAFDGGFVHSAPFATDNLDVYLQPPSTELGGPFEDIGEILLHDQTYRGYRVSNLRAGQRLGIELPLAGSWRWTLKWTAIVLGLCGAVAAFAINAKRTATPVSDRKTLEGRREELILALAACDPEASCAPRYRQLLNEAVETYFMLDSTEPDPRGRPHAQ